LKSTIDAESTAATLHSRLTLLAKTKTGGSSSGFNPYGDTPTTETTGPGNQITVTALEELAVAYMFPDEDLKAHTSDRPSDGFMKLMEWLVREIAIGLHLPFGLVWHMAGLGSPAVRFEIGQANRVFMAFLQDVIEPMWFRPIVGAWLSLEIQQGRQPFHPNWYKFKTPRPKAITIDLGRDSKAGIDENRAGLGTATDWYVEEDQDFEEQTDQLVYEAKYREAARLGVPIETIKEVPLDQIRMMTPNGNPPVDQQPQNESEQQPAL
jgi:capsid protein